MKLTNLVFAVLLLSIIASTAFAQQVQLITDLRLRRSAGAPGELSFRHNGDGVLKAYNSSGVETSSWNAQTGEFSGTVEGVVTSVNGQSGDVTLTDFPYAVNFADTIDVTGMTTTDYLTVENTATADTLTASNLSITTGADLPSGTQFGNGAGDGSIWLGAANVGYFSATNIVDFSHPISAPSGTFDGDLYIGAQTGFGNFSTVTFGETGSEGTLDFNADDAQFTFSHHIHAPYFSGSGAGLTGLQPIDTDLTALAGISSNGILTRTGAGTAAARTITGTTNLIDVTNGNGVSGNPTITVGANVARRDAANTFTGSNTFNAATNLKGVVLPVRSISGNTTLATTDYFGRVFGAAGSFTITLPTATAAIGQTYYFVVDSSHASNTVTIDSGTGNIISIPILAYGQTAPLDVTIRRRWMWLIKTAATEWFGATGIAD